MKKLTSLLVTMMALFGLLAPVPALAQTTDDVRKGVDITCTGGSCAGNPEADVENTVAKVINVLSIIVGVVSVIMIIIGGLKYVTSSGDSGNVTSAKNTILYAIIGLVVVALAQAIVRFVLNQL